MNFLATKTAISFLRRIMQQAVTINNVSVPIKPLAREGSGVYIPSQETLNAWYFAQYGTTNPDALAPELIQKSAAKFARWWLKIYLKII
jgi:hypothetical protein